MIDKPVPKKFMAPKGKDAMVVVESRRKILHTGNLFNVKADRAKAFIAWGPLARLAP